MSTDPRLQNTQLLTLAAMRLRERLKQAPAWERTVGLCALLEAAKALPRRDPWDLPDLDPRDGLARLLIEARQWQKEGDRG